MPATRPAARAVRRLFGAAVPTPAASLGPQPTIARARVTPSLLTLPRGGRRGAAAAAVRGLASSGLGTALGAGARPRPRPLEAAVRHLSTAAGAAAAPAPNHYAMLGVGRGAGPEEIKRSFFAKSREYHPDLNQEDPAAPEHFRQVVMAYETLCRPGARRTYDASIAAETATARASGAHGMPSMRQPAAGMHPSLPTPSVPISSPLAERTPGMISDR
jgi:hypothetical protein